MFLSVVTAAHTHHLLWARRNGLPPRPNTLHLGCSYLLHFSHCFLSSCGVVMLRKIEIEKMKLFVSVVFNLLHYFTVIESFYLLFFGKCSSYMFVFHFCSALTEALELDG